MTRPFLRTALRTRGARIVLAAVVVCAGCRARSDDGRGTGGHGTAPAVPADWFVDRAETAGLNFAHVNGMTGQFYQAEMMGAGAAMFDYDGDGDLDVYLVQGGPLGPANAAHAATSTGASGGRLYRNDLEVHADGTRTLRFVDVTEQSGIRANGYGMGVATGDFNNDGCVDLYLTNFGRNQLYRNNCDGTFTDVSKASGTDDAGWSVSATFVDVDRDGWLDLFVGHYLNFDLSANKPCFNPAGVRDYCPPGVYQPQRSRLYHNNHDGTFTDVTEKAGLGREFGPALGVVAADFNNDGWIDLYVANDEQENQLWLNQRNGTFKNAGLLSGTALPVHGKAEASMGVDAGDFDNDGDEDLYMAELSGQGSNLYVNDGSALFEDRSARSGLEAMTLGSTGFGTAWFDYDNDGWLDLLAVNGAVQAIESLARAHDPFPLHQRRQLFRNLGDGRFSDVSAQAGAVFAVSDVGRGAAFGDIDNDGDVDVLVTNNNGRARLLVNEVGNRRHWLGLRLVGAHVPRDMVGARVSIIRPGLPTLWRRTRADGSYASANDPRVLAGLGDATAAPRVRVRWPSGHEEEWTSVPIDRYTTLQEGGGR